MLLLRKLLLLRPRLLSSPNETRIIQSLEVPPTPEVSVNSNRRGIRLLDLNEDVLSCILEELFLQRCLKPISKTCKALRRLSEPLLFRRCVVEVDGPIAVHMFPPTSFWRYVRSLSLLDDSLRRVAFGDGGQQMVNLTLCEYLIPELLIHVLQRMPSLRALVVASPTSENHGLSWSFLKAMLTSPQLREFELRFIFPSTIGAQTEELEIDIAPLISFTYWTYSGRGDPRWHPAEREVLAIILAKLSCSLQKLMLPIEPVPLEVLQNSHWRHLRDLTLHGEADPHLTVSYVTVLGNMPELRSLVLGFELLPHVGAQVVWPSGLHLACPWPKLESFTVSYPHPYDQVYSRLPPTLRSLATCCSSYHFLFLRENHASILRRGWQSPLLTASQTLQLLGRCHYPALTELAVEFGADEHEFDVLDRVARAFPRVTSLTVNVYRDVDRLKDIPVQRIAHALAPLDELQTLRIHLGYQIRPACFVGVLAPALPLSASRSKSATRAERAAADLKKARDRAAKTLADTLAPSLRIIYLLHASAPGPYWLEYRVARGPRRGGIKRCALGGEEFEVEYAHGMLLTAPEKLCT